MPLVCIANYRFNLLTSAIREQGKSPAEQAKSLFHHQCLGLGVIQIAAELLGVGPQQDLARGYARGSGEMMIYGNRASVELVPDHDRALLGPDGPTGTYTRWENEAIPW